MGKNAFFSSNNGCLSRIYEENGKNWEIFTEKYGLIY
jgi:hypothetical protein